MPSAAPLNRRFAPIAPVMAAALLSACTLGPDFQSPAAPGATGYAMAGDDGAGPYAMTGDDGAGPAPAAASGTDAQQVRLTSDLTGDWWALFRSPPLDQAVRQAVAGNPSLAAATATLTQAQEQARAVAGSRLPQADLSAGIGRQQLNLSAFGMPGPNPVFNLFSLGPTVSFPLDIFGRLQRQAESAVAQADAQGYRVAATYLTLTGNVAVQVITIAGLRGQIDAVNEIVAADQQNLDLVQAQVRAGTGTDVDLETARSQLANDRTLLPPLRQQLSAARHRLAVLSGELPGQWQAPDFDLATITLPRDLPVALPSELVHRRPDILAAEATLHAATATVGVATARLYPDITLTAAIAQGALSPENLFSGHFTGWNLTAGLTAPLFHGGTLKAEQRAAEAAAQAALADYRQTVVDAFGQVADLLQALVHDQEEHAEQRRALDAASSAVRLARISYGAGNSGIVQVLEVQRQFQQARLGYVRAQTQRLIDTAQLFVATGAGWRPAPALPGGSDSAAATPVATSG